MLLPELIEHTVTDHLQQATDVDPEDYSLLINPDLRGVLCCFDEQELNRLVEEFRSEKQSRPQTYCHTFDEVKSPPTDMSYEIIKKKPRVKTKGISCPPKIESPQKEAPRDAPSQPAFSLDWRPGIKTRKILQELYHLGFSPVSKNGSHQKLVFADRVVIIPESSTLPIGTLKSVANQARGPN